MGCTATAIIGAFLAVNSSPFHAALHAMAVMGVCGELSGKLAKGPGSFRTNFMDTLAELGPQQLETLRVAVQ
jgi:hydroxyethylthiazole kinase